MSQALAERLIAAGLIKPEAAESAAELVSRARKSLAEVLVETGAGDELEIYREAAAQRGVALASADELFAQVDAGLSHSLPRPYQNRRRVMPISRQDGNLLVVSCDPEAQVLELGNALDADRVELRLVTPTDLRRLQWAVDLGQLPATSDAVRARVRGADLLAHDVRMQPQHVGLLDALLADAVGERASDLHLERYGRRVRVRLRVDGDLYDVSHYRLRVEQLAGVVNALKVRARLDIAETRAPQGGRCSLRLGGRAFDLRIQTQPSLHGEHVVARFLAQDRERIDVESLGFSHELAARFVRALASPSGLVLVTGPTGSGKTTTLNAGLQKLASQRSRKVISVEDPIEYAIDDVQQTQVNAAVGFDFASAVRVLVRQDPDVILIGEIRDPETALEALRAAQTGHLVLSTIHANDAVDAVQRLFDLGQHPNSIAAELLAVFSQRLAKRICVACREPSQPHPALLREIFPRGAPADFRAFRGRGCERCRGRGSYGRIAIGELLPTSRDLRLAISHHVALDELRAAATTAGLVPLRASAPRWRRAIPPKSCRIFSGSCWRAEPAIPRGGSG
jgi:type IV pilus assembly protein PilB